MSAGSADQMRGSTPRRPGAAEIPAGVGGAERAGESPPAGGPQPRQRASFSAGRQLSALHSSVFTRLVAIMVTMAVGLLAIVGGFFTVLVGPNLHSSMNQVLREYTRGVAATAPDRAKAADLSARLGIETRYTGPAGDWATRPDLPTIAEVQRAPAAWQNSGLRHNCYLVPAPDGGAYLFAWTLGSRLGELHRPLVTLLLLIIAGVIVVTYVVLRRLLAPLRALNDGVARLTAGELDVELPVTTPDEFGRLTQAFNRMVARVRAMIGARDQLLLDVSHELRSPLTRLKVALELSPPGPQRAGMAADLSEMERMIAELLELERLRSGRGLTKVRQDLRPILREMADTFGDTPPGVRVFLPDAALWVDADGEKVRVVVRNLLENAAKYSLPHSRPVEVSAAEEDGRVVVRVTDDGPGIPEAESERVFEPFFRVDRSRSKNTGGYGLGLSLCKRVMQAHGGDITLERPHRTGASFVLRFAPAGPR